MLQHKVKIELLLEPVGAPDVVISCNHQHKEIIVVSPIRVEFQLEHSSAPMQLTVKHRNRSHNDGVTAVIVKSVKINSIESPKIVYQGIYHPVDMISRQTNYIDYNGIWVLDFTVPVYTWLHKILDLGWIYD